MREPKTAHPYCRRGTGAAYGKDAAERSAQLRRCRPSERLNVREPRSHIVAGRMNAPEMAYSDLERIGLVKHVTGRFSKLGLLLVQLVAGLLNSSASCSVPTITV